MDRDEFDHKVKFSRDQIAELRDTFKTIDVNNNGKISKAEFARAIKKYSSQVKQGSIDFAFKVADKHHTEEIDFEEFLDFYYLLSHPQEDVKSAKLVFDAFDEDHSGTLTQPELFNACKQLGVKCTLSQVAKCYDFLDKNHDGDIDFGEFYRLYKTVCSLGGE